MEYLKRFFELCNTVFYYHIESHLERGKGDLESLQVMKPRCRLHISFGEPSEGLSNLVRNIIYPGPIERSVFHSGCYPYVDIRDWIDNDIAGDEMSVALCYKIRSRQCCHHEKIINRTRALRGFLNRSSRYKEFEKYISSVMRIYLADDGVFGFVPKTVNQVMKCGE